MQAAVFCYAPQDAALAREIGAYLETNLPISPSYDECVIGPDRDLIDSVERALSAEIAIALISPDSVPTRWERARWEPVFLKYPAESGAKLYLVLARPCKFPELLRRHAFFDCSESLLGGLRALKRHVFAPRRVKELPPEVATETFDLESLRAELADQPGSPAELPRDQALAFAHQIGADFEGVFWIDCAYRSAAGILGDTAKMLGLTLTGFTEQNRGALRAFCEERRCLFVFEGLSPGEAELVAFEGRSSVITLAPGEKRALLSVQETLMHFSRWAQNVENCFRHLGDVHAHLLKGGLTWKDQVRLGSAVVATLKHGNRLAEANEMLELLISHSLEQADSDALRGFLWDQSWILGHWGEPYMADVLPLAPETKTAQLGFAF